jgi:hypothetical protein
MSSEGTENVKGDERPDRPVTMKIDENVEKVTTLVRTNCRLVFRIKF